MTKVRQPVSGNIELSVDVEDAADVSVWLERRLERIRKDAKNLGIINSSVMVLSMPEFKVKVKESKRGR